MDDFDRKEKLVLLRLVRRAYHSEEKRRSKKSFVPGEDKHDVSAYKIQKLKELEKKLIHMISGD